MRGEIQTENNSVRTEFALVLAFVFDQVGVVFTIVWILLLVNRMNAASILAVAVCVIQLRSAILQEATAKFRNAIRRADVHIKCIEVMGYA